MGIFGDFVRKLEPESAPKPRKKRTVPQSHSVWDGYKPTKKDKERQRRWDMEQMLSALHRSGIDVFKKM